jgi:hypothetical protein
LRVGAVLGSSGPTLALALTGFGGQSLDHVLGLASRWTPVMTAIVLVVGMLGGVATLALRRPSAAGARAPSVGPSTSTRVTRAGDEPRRPKAAREVLTLAGPGT